MPTKLITWNINGLRASIKNGHFAAIQAHAPDILCLQEIKVDAAALPTIDYGFAHCSFNSAQRKGYSGTACLSQIHPISVNQTCPANITPDEGRTLTLEFPHYYLVNVYVPNSGAELIRLPFRSKIWDPAFQHYLLELAKKKPVIACGDFNVAHDPIDLANPDSNHFSAGFTDEERAGFDNLLNAGFIDLFRARHPNAPKHYTWWSNRAHSRERNIGWRIDYFLISPDLLPHVADIRILKDHLGSDHAPVELTLRDMD